jgi:hypothetical protein
MLSKEEQRDIGQLQQAVGQLSNAKAELDKTILVISEISHIILSMPGIPEAWKVDLAETLEGTEIQKVMLNCEVPTINPLLQK